jgi:hypothetical protein
MHSARKHLDGYGGDGTSTERAAVHSLASDSFVPKTRQKTALGFTPSETKEARCWTSAVWNSRGYGGNFQSGLWTLRLETVTSSKSARLYRFRSMAGPARDF